MSGGRELEFLDLRVRCRGDKEVSRDDASLPEALERIEREGLVRSMEESNGSKAGAARILGINRSTLYYRLRKHGLAARSGLPSE